MESFHFFRDKLKLLQYYANKDEEIVSEYNFISS
jgi:hypothetical protein